MLAAGLMGKGKQILHGCRPEADERHRASKLNASPLKNLTKIQAQLDSPPSFPLFKRHIGLTD